MSTKGQSLDNPKRGVELSSWRRTGLGLNAEEEGLRLNLPFRQEAAAGGDNAICDASSKRT
jgi:hypothetical protein